MNRLMAASPCRVETDYMVPVDGSCLIFHRYHLGDLHRKRGGGRAPQQGCG